MRYRVDANQFKRYPTCEDIIFFHTSFLSKHCGCMVEAYPDLPRRSSLVFIYFRRETLVCFRTTILKSPEMFRKKERKRPSYWYLYVLRGFI